MKTLFALSNVGSLPKRLSRGVAAIEMALITMLFVTSALGVTELGRAIYYYDTLAKQARSAARYLAQRDSPDSTLQTTYRNQAAQIALCGLPVCGSTRPVIPGLLLSSVIVATENTNPSSLANVRVAPAGSVPNYGTLDIVTVTITGYQFVSLASFVIPDLTFPAISVAMPRSS